MSTSFHSSYVKQQNGVYIVYAGNVEYDIQVISVRTFKNHEFNHYKPLILQDALILSEFLLLFEPSLPYWQLSLIFYQSVNKNNIYIAGRREYKTHGTMNKNGSFIK